MFLNFNLDTFFSFSLGLDCTKISCAKDCSTDYKRLASPPEVVFHLQNSTLNLNDSQYRNHLRERNLMICCESMCREGCLLPNGTVVNEKTEWQSPENPCEQFVCHERTILTHISLCRPLSCSKEHHITKPGECCPSCHDSWGDFCRNDDGDDEEDCEIACQFGFVRDEKRHCDECRCARRKQQTSTSSSTEIPSHIDDATETVKCNFYLYPNQNIFIFISVALSVTIIALLLGVGLYFHKKVYKRVPSIA